jgi:hypothetical protein
MNRKQICIRNKQKQQLMKTTILTLAMILFSTLLVNANTDPKKGFEDDKIQIVCNISTGNATILWSDARIDFIEILASNGQFMPTIPVSDAKSLHMNDLMNGTYTLVFKSGNETLYIKTLEVNK